MKKQVTIGGSHEWYWIGVSLFQSNFLLYEEGRLSMIGEVWMDSVLPIVDTHLHCIIVFQH